MGGARGPITSKLLLRWLNQEGRRKQQSMAAAVFLSLSHMLQVSPTFRRQGGKEGI